MTSSKHYASVVAALVATFGISAAQANVIDFTSSAWAAADGQQTFSSGGVSLTASGTVPVLGTSTPSRLSFNGPSCGNASVGLACAGDGIGIDRTRVPVEEADEINVTENLRVNFGSEVKVQSLDFLNLYGPSSIGFLPVPGERMEVRVNGTGSWLALGPLTSQAGGYFSGALDPALFSYVTTLDIRGASTLSEASLARISYVPIPGTAALLLMGAMGLYQMRRNKNKAD